MKKTVIILSAIFVFANASATSISRIKIENQVEYSAFGKSPLHLAISKGDVEAVKKFIMYGTNINKMVNNMTPLMVAARFNHCEIVRILLASGADASIENGHGFTALKYAEYGKATDAVVILKNLKK